MTEELYKQFGESRIKKYEDILLFAHEILQIGFKDKCEWEFDEHVTLLIGFAFEDGLRIHKTMSIGPEPENEEEECPTSTP